MKVVKYILIAVAGLMSCTALNGQSRHEFSVYAGGGLSSLNYKTTIGDQKDGFGGSFGLGYHYFFTDNIALGTGLELSLYNAKATFNSLSDKYITKDIDGNSFEFRSTVTNYEEKQNSMFVNIPVMLQYQFEGENKFYIAAGGKIGIPVSGKYKTEGATIKNSGHYTEDDLDHMDQEFLGFGTFTGRDMDEDVDFKVAFMLSLELGMKWKIGETMSLYTGAYLDYGLNDIQKDSRTDNFVAYNTASPKDFKTSSILTSKYSLDGATVMTFTDKVSPIAAGIKIRLAFGK